MMAMRGAVKWWSAIFAVATAVVALVLVGRADSTICSGGVPRSAVALTASAIFLAVLSIVLDWRSGTAVAPSGWHTSATLLATLAFVIVGLAVAYYIAVPLGCNG